METYAEKLRDLAIAEHNRANADPTTAEERDDKRETERADLLAQAEEKLAAGGIRNIRDSIALKLATSPRVDHDGRPLPGAA